MTICINWLCRHVLIKKCQKLHLLQDHCSEQKMMNMWGESWYSVTELDRIETSSHGDTRFDTPATAESLAANAQRVGSDVLFEFRVHLCSLAIHRSQPASLPITWVNRNSKSGLHGPWLAHTHSACKQRTWASGFLSPSERSPFSRFLFTIRFALRSRSRFR